MLIEIQNISNDKHLVITGLVLIRKYNLYMLMLVQSRY